ncbi:MAG TPA: hypothetical protein DF383_00810, partial [Deltaproteobacteria bacterium]|nr:hypothetical protein [Deltaproteobacteria bacterium]
MEYLVHRNDEETAPPVINDGHVVTISTTTIIEIYNTASWLSETKDPSEKHFPRLSRINNHKKVKAEDG